MYLCLKINSNTTRWQSILIYANVVSTSIDIVNKPGTIRKNTVTFPPYVNMLNYKDVGS